MNGGFGFYWQGIYYKDIFLHAKQAYLLCALLFLSSIYIYEAEVFVVRSAKYFLLYSLCHCETVKLNK